MTTEATTVPRTDLTELELEAWRGFLQTHALLARRLDASLEAEHGLPLSSYEVLLFLATASGGRMRMSELADSVLLSRSGLTRMIDRLVREGLVERASCPSDKRGLFAVLTDAGRRRFEQARAAHLQDVREQFLSQFSVAELEQLASFWARLVPPSAPESDMPPCA
jgi:DNA-binding MarR family transcriptional regulator